MKHDATFLQFLLSVFVMKKYVATNKSNNLPYESIYEKRDKDESK